MLPYNRTLYYVMGQTGKVSWCCAWINKIISKLIVWLGYLLIVVQIICFEAKSDASSLLRKLWASCQTSMKPDFSLTPEVEHQCQFPSLLHWWRLCSIQGWKNWHFSCKESCQMRPIWCSDSLKLTEQAISMAHNLSSTCKWSFKKLPMFLLFNTIFKWLN